MANPPIFSKRVCQVLHDEHAATLALTERLGTFLQRHRVEPPPTDASTTIRLLHDVSGAMETEVTRHFDFEEAELFCQLTAVGESAVGAHLTEEHEVMRPLARELSRRARTAASHGFDEPGWRAFRRVAADLCERLQGHVQKEEAILLPLLEENLVAAMDASLYDAYAGSTEAQP
jgi:iron-sulfur cluster repair protein YtfE (RIC family)